MRTVTGRSPGRDHERRHQIEHDVVVVAGVERDAIGGACLDDPANHIERAIAVERRDLDRHDVLDRREAPPERHRQHETADRGLQIEADQRDFARDRLAQCAISSSSLAPFMAASDKQPGVIAEIARDRGLLHGLRGAAGRGRRS